VLAWPWAEQAIGAVTDPLPTLPQTMLSVSVAPFALNVAQMPMVASSRAAGPMMMAAAKSKSMPMMEAKQVRRLAHADPGSPRYALALRRRAAQFATGTVKSFGSRHPPLFSGIVPHSIFRAWSGM
jgi:hypothetical protein